MKNLASLCEKAADIQKKIGQKSSGQAEMVIASKYASEDQLNELVSCGFNIFGENKVQDLLKKSEAVQGSVWHFIGHLQTNKVKYIIGLVELIQSVDSIKLAKVIDKEAAKKGIRQKVLIQVNIAREETKFGILPEGLDFFVSEVLKLDNICVCGLMAMMPYRQAKDLRVYYKDLKKSFDLLKNDFSDEFKVLSAGMSNDWQIALEEGSNMLRLGSVIFAPP